jgi:hypothetical protein
MIRVMPDTRGRDAEGETQAKAVVPDGIQGLVRQEYADWKSRVDPDWLVARGSYIYNTGTTEDRWKTGQTSRG